MSLKLAFFEIPAVDFARAVSFYQNVFGISINKMECESEKMGFFDTSTVRGAISLSEHLKPAKGGVLISFEVDDLDSVLKKVNTESGKTIMPKTAIEAECGGFFATFQDSEGNLIGLNSIK